MTSIGVLLGIGAVATAVVWVGSSALERASGRLARHYGLPRLVQGTILAALGSSAPEIASTVIATIRYGEFELGVGVVVGSAVFNILVIPALSALLADGALDTGREVVYKEAQFYMLSVAALFLVFALAVIYFPAEGDGLQGNVTRPLAVSLLLLYLLYIFVQYLDVSESNAKTTRLERRRLAIEWGLLVAGVGLIIAGVEGLVVAAIGLGEAFGTPSFLWGLTVVAAATSLPDALISVAAARIDEPAVSLGNVLGSNIFDLLVAIPAGVLLGGAVAVSFTAAVPMMAFLVVATVVLFAFARTGMEISNAEAWAMLLLYGSFIAWLLLESIGVIDIV
ncbi:homolog to sodium/calcium antiporter [Natronomonas pharaonis DSM 2160]|uniref:Homolog to sodium/calcium antiporter n=1 Tax=Natronomonas pharaonis (strain ATCC 35678 / DSM 2160 / CIP 103997 / JCM 8858 / NBRC 14720 / NCIMB 2260 / Gabara) TaxID=348780 RepID=A0A1U7EZ09_NATPD|nr:sodium:calcium antiporter [Natronomonas pharaonis]CAI50480.1 homolog to sodium/calcium antiporter [Natronomonas pharaonis DSM 2160]